MEELQTIDADSSLADRAVTDQTPVSQETQPETQVTEEPQKSDDSQVETTEPQATSEGTEREKPKPSDFYRERREKQYFKQSVSQLQSELAELKNLLKAKPSEPTAPKPKPDLFVDPDSYLSDREQRLREEMKKEILGELTQSRQAEERNRSMQEATEIIFPKSGPDDKRSLAERVQENPELADKVQNLLNETGLEVLSQTHPLQAAKLLQKLIESEQPKVVKNPTAIKKELTGSTATGSPISAGGKTMPTLQDVKSQLSELDKKVDEDPNYRYEDEYVTKNRQLQNQLVMLARESGKAK